LGKLLVFLHQFSMKIHLIAIGGSAMHNLALAMHKKGHNVSGSDDAIFEPSKSRLESEGLLPEKLGWFSEKITTDIDAIILGMHAKEDNIELLKAQELNLKIYSYPEFLYQQSKNKTRVVIGGSHGKTTITAMILHTMKYFNINVDYMVGAKLDGFHTMVHLTEGNDFIVLEGDEYLSSPIDKRPKFHLYKPNIALLSGIAWDHINVFPTYENYLEQFEVFIKQITSGGVLVYNQEDKDLVQLVESTTNPIRKIPYQTPENYFLKDNTTYLSTPEGDMPIQVFGKHNLNNIIGAKWICQQMGVDEIDFFEAIASFKGASMRLEKISENKNRTIFKDFAHSPSKVQATTQAVREQYPDSVLIACLELHTYSSLTFEFLKEYQYTLDNANIAVVFYSPEALKIKRLASITKEQIQKSFQRNDLIIFTHPKDFQNYLYSLNLKNAVLLLMSSGNYGGLDWNDLVKKI